MQTPTIVRASPPSCVEFSGSIRQSRGSKGKTHAGVSRLLCEPTNEDECGYLRIVWTTGPLLMLSVPLYFGSFHSAS